jgi:hypothetical protein
VVVATLSLCSGSSGAATLGLPQPGIPAARTRISITNKQEVNFRIFTSLDFHLSTV